MEEERKEMWKREEEKVPCHTGYDYLLMGRAREVRPRETWTRSVSCKSPGSRAP